MRSMFLGLKSTTPLSKDGPRSPEVPANSLVDIASVSSGSFSTRLSEPLKPTRTCEPLTLPSFGG